MPIPYPYRTAEATWTYNILKIMKIISFKLVSISKNILKTSCKIIYLHNSNIIIKAEK